MIKIEYDIKLPKNCDTCPLFDDEFDYCHGHLEAKAWELVDNYIKGINRPNWCPLVEVKENET